MRAVIWILSGCVVLLAGYVIILQSQFRRINKQLENRQIKRSRQYISLEFVNRELSRLAENINTCLKAEENLRLGVLHEEREFKELIANISHDLRTPLTAVKGYLQLLNQTDIDFKQREKLDIARRHAQDLEQLVEHFFEYSFLIGTEPKLQIERIHLTNLITEYLAESFSVLESYGCIPVIRESAAVFAHGDREHLKRIVQNLLRNSLQHGAGEIEVGIYNGKQAGFFVRNKIAADVHIDTDKIFQRFYTGDKARQASAGLGLSIVKVLAEQMGGTAAAAVRCDQLEVRIELPKSS